LYRGNLRHVLLCTQRVARRLVDAGQPGSVINVTSIEGVRAAPGYAAYAAAKAGVINYTKTAALELASHNIRVNALAPDLTVTEGLLRVSPNGLTASAGHMIPMGRPGHVDEMAGAAVFLASNMSSYITRADDPRRRWNAGRERLVPQPADRRLPTGARLVQCVQPSAA
jgi:3-oxoacyl-[acyl-carrier protein] reductase